MQDLGISILLDSRNMLRLLEGLWITVRIAFLSVAISMVLGIVLGMIMTLKNPIIKALTRIYLEAVRIMPQLVLLFLVYFGLTKAFNVHLSGELSAIIVFVFWGTAEMGDLVRGALISIPKHQYESGRALGLTSAQIYQHIIIPQTFRRLLPLAINLTTRMVKTTSLIVMIGVVEVLKVGQQIIEANRYTAPSAALWVYGAIFFLYFLVCFPISRLAGRLEKRWQG
ncbi:amino acid ABC transporter permease [Clostridium minihomine]|uniref:amino acid ABC transporter permease n=1 Tax=Clostridium minihomine TaxID=2045012 RepID=UPI000C767B86|nr:amino acid ABC transporter permease [Clostridium minihomine]